MSRYENMSIDELEQRQQELTRQRQAIQTEAREVTAALDEKLRTDRAKRKAAQDPNRVQQIGAP